MDTLTNNRKWYEVTSAMLHIIAMLFMLSDHMWSTLLPTQVWMTCIGRIAFPIFAFMLVEGYFHTRSFKKYLLRMLIFALISEIPFNLMMGGVINPFDQNVMWTFLLALLGMKLMELIKRKWRKAFDKHIAKSSKTKYIPVVLVTIGWGALIALVVLLFYILGMITFVDYHGEGILMVFAFFILRGRKWWNYIAQFIAMYYINVTLLGSLYYPVSIFGFQFDFYQQAFGLLALIPIWLYKGRQGHHSKPFKYFCYAFYPVHMLILVGIGYLMQLE
ncbi:MAG: conjugal transfer protein TraX [Clostridia bacterium]|nr:conjugal transfer protein TraX [Clostridia bacterium]